MKKPINEAQAIERMVWWTWVPVAFIGILVFLILFWGGVILGLLLIVKAGQMGWIF
jgi:hypothetical protein